MWWFASVPLVAVGGSLAFAEPGTDQLRKVPALVERLGDRSYEVRELAGRRLRVIGEPALPALRVASRDHPQIEVRRRAERLVEQVMRTACRSPTAGITFAFVEEGRFVMGAPAKEPGRKDYEEPHDVRITRPFLIGLHEVTQREFRAVNDANASWFSPEGKGREKIVVKGEEPNTDDHPVDSVTWFDAVDYCNRLSRRDGLPTYYELERIERNGASIVDGRVTIRGGIGYRLPSEAEWEYACRAGTTTAFHFGKSGRGGNYRYAAPTSYGSSRERGADHTVAHGAFPSNGWGLVDTHGNVAEWCGDWYDKTYYRNSPVADPQGPATGIHRVVRGGSWLVNQASCRSASRFWHVPGKGTYFIGFRVARLASNDMIRGRLRPESDDD